MGKTSTNERIKYRATFFNNSSVALFIGGFFIPLFSAFGRDKFFIIPIDVIWRGEARFDGTDLRSLLDQLLLFSVMIAFSLLFRHRADVLLRKIED